MVVKVSPSEGKTGRHLESLRKAEKAWVGTNETQTKTSCKEKLEFASWCLGNDIVEIVGICIAYSLHQLKDG